MSPIHRHQSAAAAFGLALALVGLSAESAGPYPTNMCAGTRTPGLGCSANDVAIAQVRVTNGVTSCVAGSTVDVALEVDLQSNANARYDIGVFVPRDGRLANQDVSSGGSADCAVYGLPKSPDPLADLNGNVCGDLSKSNKLATVSLGTVSVLCVPDQNGKLRLPATITWQQNANAKCESPAAAWVEAGTPSKCNASSGMDIPIQVVGKLTIVKETLPAGTSGSFAFTAAGATPASFSLTHGKQQELTTGALTSTPISVTVTEALATGFDPTVELDCKTVDGGAAVATLDPVKRKVTVPMDASQSRVTCTFRNKAESRIRVVKKTVGGNGDFPFSAAQQDFTITTASGSGEKVLSALSEGQYTVTEIVPEGWKLTNLTCDDPSGGTKVDLAGKTATVALAAGETVTCTFTNEKESVSGSGKQITLVARQCTSYTAIMANLARNNIQESLKDLGKDTVYTRGQPISRAIEDANNSCFAMAVPWTFTLGRGIGGKDQGEWGSLSKVNGEFRSVTTTLAGVPERDPAGNVAGATIPSAITIDLTNEEAAQVGAGLWIQGGSPGHPLNNQETTYGFGALRCAVDNYNGDNVESNAFPNGSKHVFCYAYYVVPPPTSGTITVVKRNGGTERTDFKFRGNISYTPDPSQPGENNHLFTLSPAGGSSDQAVFYRAAGSTWNVREEVPVGWVLASANCETTRGSKVTTNAAGDFSIALLADDVVTCTYVNNAQPPQPVDGEIRIVKNTTGGDGAFPFQGYAVAQPNQKVEFTMTTSGGSAPARSMKLAAGNYKVDELVPSGWKVSSISCSDPTNNSSGSGNSATINLAAGETVTCTFTNAKDAPATGTINIAKKTVGGDGSFAFTGSGTGLGNFTLTTSGGTAPQKSFTGLAAGTYRVIEQVPAGWTLSDISCVDPTGNSSGLGKTATIVLAAGETVTCTFTNSKNAPPAPGAITIIKSATGASATDRFTFQAPPGLDGEYAAGQSKSITASQPGLYTVQEIVPAGWKLAAIACRGGSVTYTGATTGATSGFEAGDTTANITVALGDTVSCTFTNVKDAPSTGTLTITKSATGAAATDRFAFTGPSGIAGDYAAGESRTVQLQAGNYVVTELVPSGWTLSGIACTGGSVTYTGASTGPTSGFEAGDTTANITMAQGSSVSCTFTNTKNTPPPGTINIVKSTVGGNGSFSFVSSVPGGQNFSLTTSGGTSPTRSFTEVAAGTYTVTEQVPAGWKLTAINCTDPTGNSTGSGTTAAVNLAAGETVTCTFTNTAAASIEVEKVATGGDATFPFAGTKSFSIATTSGSGRDTTTFASMAAGAAVTITEAAPAGWVLTSASCRDAATGAAVGTGQASGVQVTPAAGQRVICTFANTRLAQLTVRELSSPKAPQAFAYTTTGSGLANFSLVDDGSGTGNTRVFANLVPGQAYAVVQAAVAGWSTPLILCNDRAASDPAHRSAVDIATRSVTPNLQPGENLTCVFGNVQVTPGSITVNKVAAGGDDSFAFANSGGAAGSATNPAAFTIATTSSGGTRALTGLAVGTYTITETVPGGWLSPAKVQCSVQSGTSTTITPVASGATIALGQTGATVDSVSCTFDNTKAGRITIIEDATPDSAQAFAYTAQGTGVPASFSLTNDGTPTQADRRAFDGLTAGAYQFTVATPAGWRLTAIQCANGATTVNVGAGQANVTLAAGDDVTCTYRHAREGTISITKSAAGAAASDRFTFTGPAGLAGDYAAGETRSIASLPGVYTVTEVIPSGWRLDGISCTGGVVTYSGAAGTDTSAFEPGDTTANIRIAAGESVACTFTNTARGGVIAVRKETVGGQGIFAFTGAEDFQIDTRQRRVPVHLIEVVAGTHVVREIVPDGWRLTGLTCSGNSTVNLATATATIQVASGDRVSCVYTNEKLGRIEIVKSIRGESTGDFRFSAPASLDPSGQFVLSPTVAAGSAKRVFENVVTGEYAVSELAPPDPFALLSITCTDPTGNTTTDVASRTAAVRVAPGETVSCSYLNVTTATLLLGAVSVEGQATFGFTVTSSPAKETITLNIETAAFNQEVSFGQRSQSGLLPQVYTLTALPAPPGWTFFYLQCASSSGEQHWTITGPTATVTLPDGETIRCYYFYVPSSGVGGGGAVPIPVFGPLASLLLALLLAAGGWFVGFRKRD